MYGHRHVILHLSAKFRNNQTMVGGVMTLYLFFSRWPTAAILDLMWVMLDHPQSAIAGLSLILKFGFDPINSFGDIAIFIFCRFDWKLPIPASNHRSNPQKDDPCAETRRLSHKA